MRKYSGYTHFDFIYGRNSVPFYSSTFFELIDSIKREINLEEKEWKDIEKKNNQGGTNK